MTTFKHIGEGVVGASHIALTLTLSPLLQPWYSHWGATSDELNDWLPGDELVPDPQCHYTHAVTIHAPRPQVWAWIAQLGHGRGGMYSYDWLENLIGCDMHSADHLLPEYQRLEIGQKIAFGPEGYPANTIHAFEDAHYLLTYDRLNMATGEGIPADQPLPDDYTLHSWLFYLHDMPKGTRLITRGRTQFSPSLKNQIIWQLLTDPIAFVMERKMLLGIKARAEHTPPSAESH